MTNKVRRRHVFYISGFDPRGARHYHAMYSEHARRQACLNGLRLDVSPRHKMTPVSHVWRVSGEGVETEIEFLSWTDIIHDNWKNDLAALWADSWLCFKSCIANGVIFKFLRVRKSLCRLAVLYPFFYLPFAFLLALWAAHGIAGAASAQNAEGFAFSALVALAASGFLFWCAVRLGHRIAIFWLLRIFCFALRWSRGQVAGLDDRLDAFAARVREEVLASRADEIMVVGHSAGAMLAIPVIARALRGLPAGSAKPKIAFLSLSNCIPLISFLPWAEEYRKDLAEVATSPCVIWTDYSAPPDGASFSQIDPVVASGCDVKSGPRMLSPRFHRLYEAKKYRRLKYNWFNLHFLYLQSSDFKGAYDYFDITAGPRSFATRFAAEAAHE